LKDFFSLKDDVPPQLKDIFHFLKGSVSKKFKDLELQMVSCLFFLRLITPALVSPTEYGVLPSTYKVSKKVSRTLLLISKAMQNVANKQSDNKKEPFMICLKKVTEEYIRPTFQFLKEISEIGEDVKIDPVSDGFDNIASTMEKTEKIFVELTQKELIITKDLPEILQPKIIDFYNKIKLLYPQDYLLKKSISLPKLKTIEKKITLQNHYQIKIHNLKM